MFNNEELARFRERLELLRARLQGDMQHLTDGALGRDRVAGVSQSPTHLAELGTETYEQDFSLRFAENDRELIGEVVAALSRIEEGTYGICAHCQTEGRAPSKSMIPKLRLRAIPYSRNCVNCERKLQEQTS